MQNERKMHKNKTSKDKSSSSHQRHDSTDGESEPRIHYEIISSDIVVNNASDSSGSKEITKSRPGSAGLAESTESESEGKTNNTRSNETALGRLKRKFKRKSSKSCEEGKSTVDAMNRQSDNTSRSFANVYRQKEHIYDVPFSNSGVSKDDDEHVYQNGHIWAENNQVSRNSSATEKDELESNDEIRGEANAAVGKHNWHLPKSKIDNESSREERWQQGKSMSLPVARVSAKPPGKSPDVSPSREINESEGSDEDTIEPLPDNKPVANTSYNMLMRTRSLPVPSKMDYNHQFLSGLNDLCKRGWYWGPLSSKEAEVMLRGKLDGTFLVRDSNDNRYLLSLSFRSEMRTLHTRIEFCKGKFSFYAAPFITSGCHVSIVDLIEDCVEKSKEKVFCYSKGRGNNGAAFPVRLMKPISRFEQVCSLQHLCRFVIRQHFTLENIGDMPLPGMMKRYLNKNHFDATKQG